MPELEFDLSGRSGSGADIKGQANNETQPERSEPEEDVGIEIFDQDDHVPDEIAPQDEPAGGKVGEVTQ